MAEALFFALWPDARVRSALQGLRQRLPDHGGREPHAADLHLTLAYLGPISAEQRGCVEKAAGRVRTGSFALDLDTLGFWRRPGILWCAPGQTPAGLLDLLDELTPGLTACGMTLDQRPFKPHITLARKARHRFGPVEIEPIAWPVNAFVLAQGQPGRRPRYRILARWPLES